MTSHHSEPAHVVKTSRGKAIPKKRWTGFTDNFGRPISSFQACREISAAADAWLKDRHKQRDGFISFGRGAA